MSITEWRELGAEHAKNGQPCTPPPLGPIGSAYREGYNEAAS
ncbi:hypothetical protein [Microbacterium sp. LMI12-1-1.1]